MLTLKNHKRALLLVGDTKEIKEKLKEAGGRWNGTLKGWIFKPDAKESILKGIDGVVDETTESDIGKSKTFSKVYILTDGEKRGRPEGERFYSSLEKAKKAADPSMTWCEEPIGSHYSEDEYGRFKIQERDVY